MEEMHKARYVGRGGEFPKSPPTQKLEETHPFWVFMEDSLHRHVD